MLELFCCFGVFVRMDRNAEKLELERKLRQCRDLLIEYPDGPINDTLRDYIEELEGQLRTLGG